MQTHVISLSTFINAIVGIYVAVATQVNMRIHFVAASIVFLLAVFLHVSLVEGLILVLSVALVMVAEMGNTAIEYLADTVTLDKNLGIKNAKDISAGGVLIAAIFSLVNGSLIFIPKILDLFR